MICKKDPPCTSEGACFAKSDNSKCTVLSDTNFCGKCPYQKKDRRITNEKYYPYKQLWK